MTRRDDFMRDVCDLSSKIRQSLDAAGDDVFRKAMYLRPRGLNAQTEMLERIHKIAFRLCRQGKLPPDQLLTIRDTVTTFRMLQRAIVNKEFSGPELTEYLHATLLHEMAE